MSRLYNYFNTCYIYGTIIDAQLDAAVTKGYITADEEATIKATKAN